MAFSERQFGRTGLTVSPLGLSAGMGSLAAREVERAYDRGIRTFYWGSYRAGRFGAGLREVAKRHRDEVTIIIQSYTRVREQGLARHLLISCHNRLTFPQYAADERYGGIMVRYNAVHPGAESEVFPALAAPRPGVACYTATRWGNLLDPAVLPSDEPPPRASDCYRFVLTHPAADLVMCAPRNGDDLDEALATLERGPMSDDELAWMKRVGAHVKKATAGRRSFNPVEIFDRLGGWLSSGKSAGLNSDLG